MHPRTVAPAHQVHRVDSHDEGLRQQVVAVYREVGRRGLIAGSSGNVSHRTRTGMIITPSGCSAETLEPDGLVAMTLAGDVKGDGDAVQRMGDACGDLPRLSRRRSASCTRTPMPAPRSPA